MFSSKPASHLRTWDRPETLLLSHTPCCCSCVAWRHKHCVMLPHVRARSHRSSPGASGCIGRALSLLMLPTCFSSMRGLFSASVYHFRVCTVWWLVWHVQSPFGTGTDGTTCNTTTGSYPQVTPGRARKIRSRLRRMERRLVVASSLLSDEKSLRARTLQHLLLPSTLH